MIEKRIIHWYIRAFKIREGKKQQSYNLGYCTFGKGAAFLDAENGIKCLIVHDVFADSTECEDARHCLNLACPANRAQVHRLPKAYGIKNREELEKLHENLTKWTKSLEITNDRHEHGTITAYPKCGLEISIKKGKR